MACEGDLANMTESGVMTRRLCDDYAEFMEKIRVLENGYDDYVMELFKAYAALSMMNGGQGFTPEKLLFERAEGDVFILSGISGGETKQISVPAKLYTQLEAKIMKMPQPQEYAMLDMLAPDVPFLEAPAAVQIPAGLETLPADAVGWFVLLVMALLGLSIAWSLIRSKMILLPVIVPIPMFMLSLIYTDLPIAYWAVFLLLLYFGTCLVTGSLRVYDAERCGAVTLAILLGVFLLGVVIRLASPPETYEPISFEQRQHMIGDKVQELVDDVKSALNNRVKHTEDLTDEEEWKRTGDQILSLRTSEAGELYLRAYSLGRYERNAWRSVSNYTGTWQSMAALGERLQRGGDPLLSMEIQAERSEMLYTPYGFVPEEGLKLSESFLTADGRREYEWTFLDEIPEAESMPESEAAYLAWAQEQYTITDKTESARLAEFAKAAGLKDTASGMASVVGDIKNMIAEGK